MLQIITTKKLLLLSNLRMLVKTCVNKVSRYKTNKVNNQKQRLAENVHNSTHFWRERKEILLTN